MCQPSGKSPCTVKSWVKYFGADLKVPSITQCSASVIADRSGVRGGPEQEGASVLHGVAGVPQQKKFSGVGSYIVRGKDEVFKVARVGGVSASFLPASSSQPS